MFPEWTWIVGLMLGATIGSFLNVVIYRLPRRLSLADPPKSFCPNCKHSLGVPDLFPLFSWLVLRGKCRHCKAKVSSRYFFVELVNGAIWAGIWWQFFVVEANPAKAIAYAAAASILVTIIFIDWELLIIPDEINALLFVVGLVYNGWLFYRHSPAAVTWGLPSSLIGALVGVLTLWGIAFLGRIAFGKDAMGHGDIKMARGVGAVLFPVAALTSFGIAVVFGAVFGIAQILLFARDDVVKSDAASGSDDGTASEPSQPDQEEYEPESIGSLLKCLVGYVLCLDIVGLFAPKFYERYFGEPQCLTFEEEFENFEVERTMIPFGPYLAAGAIAVVVFGGQIQHGLDRYWNFATGGENKLEQVQQPRGQ